MRSFFELKPILLGINIIREPIVSEDEINYHLSKQFHKHDSRKSYKVTKNDQTDLFSGKSKRLKTVITLP